jgi:hypothetical protein
MQGNLHVPFLGGWAGAIPPGYPADEETGRKVLRLVLTQRRGRGDQTRYLRLNRATRWSLRTNLTFPEPARRALCAYNLTTAAAESEPDMDSTTLALPYGVYRLEDLAEKGIGIGRVEPPHDEHQVAFRLDPGHVPTSAQGVVA